MISNLKAFALFAISTSPVFASGDVSFASGGSLCAGADKDTTIYIGKKGSTDCNANSLPTEFIGMKAEGFAFLTNEKDYLSNQAAEVEVVAAATGPGDSGNSFHTVGPFATTLKFDDDKTQVAFANAGTYMGTVSKDGAYGFVGTASYLGVKGTTSFKTNSFRVPGNTKFGDAVDDICVVDLKVDGDKVTCDGTAQTISAGDYKYSLYGAVLGNGYADFLTNAAGGGPYTHFGVRNVIATKNMKGSLKVAGDVEVIVNHAGADFSGKVSAIPAAGFSGVKKLEIKGGNTKLKIVFPQKYNIGKIEDGKPVPKKTKNIVINLAKGNADGFFLDFIFEAKDELKEKDGYFVYDPSVMDGDATDAAPYSGAQGSSVAGVLSLMALSGVFLF